MLCPYCNTDFQGNFCTNCGRSPNTKAKCPKCGTEFSGKFCNVCGTSIEHPTSASTIYIQNTATAISGTAHQISPKNKWIAFFLCLFLGYFGIHRFYVGKIGSGILYCFTMGMFGVGWLVDLISIFLGGFRDKNGCFLKS